MEGALRSLLALALAACAASTPKGEVETGVPEESVEPGEIVLTPLEHSFGDVDTATDGPTTLTAPLLVENQGAGPLSISGTAGGVTAADGSPVLSITGAPLSLEPGESADLQAVFHAGTGGVFEGLATVLSDDPETPAVEVVLRGRALAPGVHAEPDLLDFGVVVAGTTAELVLKVGNAGFGELTVSDLTIGDGSPDEGAFVLFQGELPAEVEPETQRAYVLQFRPSAPGPHTATATIASDDPGVPELVVGLMGQGR